MRIFALLYGFSLLGAPAPAPSPELSYEWTCVTSNAQFAPRDGAGALVYRDAMWLIGGWNPRDKVHFPKICTNDVWRSTDGVQWQEVPDTPWAPRHASSIFVYDNALWVVTGNNMQSDVWKLERR